jgi:hypothetical protein
MDNKPEFKIHGLERRKLKREVAEKKSFLRNFWHMHQLDKDMAYFYGSSEDFPMNDERAEEIYNRTEAEIVKLENSLKEPY